MEKREFPVFLSYFNTIENKSKHLFVRGWCFFVIFAFRSIENLQYRGMLILNK